MFDVLDDLEDAIEKIAACEGFVDVARISKLAERLEFQRVRAVGEFDRSCSWAAEGYVSPASALRAKTRCSHGQAFRSVRLARKLEQLPETAAAFASGAISREHVHVITRQCTPERLPMFQAIEPGLVDFAQQFTLVELAAVVQDRVDAWDGDGGGGDDEHQNELNKVTLSSTLGRRGILNGSLDRELTDLALTAFDAEMEVLRQKGDTRTTPQLRADALVSICRQYLASRSDSTARGRGQTHVAALVDIAKYENSHPDLVAAVRAEFAHGQRLSRATLERISCDCKISRVIMDGPSCVLDVGWTTRNVSNAAVGTPSSPATSTAPNPAAPSAPGSARRITSGTGSTAVPPTSTTSSCCAGSTTENSTSTTPRPARANHDQARAHSGADRRQSSPLTRFAEREVGVCIARRAALRDVYSVATGLLHEEIARELGLRVVAEGTLARLAGLERRRGSPTVNSYKPSGESGLDGA